MHRERRAVLRGIAALAGVAVGSGTGVAVGTSTERIAATISQQVAADLQPGATLFDLDGDGEFAVTVERAAEEMRDDDHPRPVHVTSGGRSTVDYAVTAVEPPAGTTLGGLDELSFDYYRSESAVADASAGASTTDGGTSADDSAGRDDSGAVPGETFVVVENDDGRHGAYFTPADPAPAVGEWRTFDVLDRLTGGGTTGDSGTDATGRWFEYTGIEAGYDGESFRDAVSRFGADARLVLVGVGHGDAVAPTVLDAYYGNLVVDGETREFPVEVVDRVS